MARPTTGVHQGHHARKRFGQNFLVDDGVIHAIVAAIDPKPDDVLVEIGPGLGALTVPLGRVTLRLAQLHAGTTHDLWLPLQMETYAYTTARGMLRGHRPRDPCRDRSADAPFFHRMTSSNRPCLLPK